MELQITPQRRLISPFIFDFKSISNSIREDKIDIYALLLTMANIIAVGYATALRPEQLSFFFPSLGKAVPVLSAFLIGIVFQTSLVFLYSQLQTVFLVLFNARVTIRQAISLVGFASIWFTFAVLIISTNLFLGVVLALVSFAFLFISYSKYLDIGLISAFFGVGFASLVTGLISLLISLSIFLII